MSRLSLPYERPTRRSHEVNWGDKTRLSGNEKSTLAWISVEESQTFTVYGKARILPENARATVFVTIEWGHGGASIDQEYEIIDFLRVPVTGSMVKVSGRLLDEFGQPPPDSVSADVALCIAPGSDGMTLRNTRWISQQGCVGVISPTQARVMSVEGFNAGDSPGWLMLFDGVPQPGGVPAMAFPVGAGRRFQVRRFDAQGFRFGVHWIASSTPLKLTADDSASLRVDVELLL